MERFFPRILQIGILVADLESTISNYEGYGVGPWERIEFGPELFPKMLVNGQPGMVTTRIAVCRCYDGVELELIQPVSESRYMEHLRKHGPGLHHLAMTTKNGNGEFHTLLNAEMERGKQPWLWLKEDNGLDRVGMEAAYLDMRQELGLILEVYNEDK